LREGPAAILLVTALLAGCGFQNSRKVIVIGVDGMDPGFVEHHWADLPNLDRLRHQGSFSRLATTTPPQSPVAWSTFITGLDPGDHGIFDFVHRDPATHELFLSTGRTIAPRFTLPLGPYVLPLAHSRVESRRKGREFWRTLAEHGIPVTVMRMPANYPPPHVGKELAGMETPDLRGTQGTFSFYTDNPRETSRAVPGGLIRRVDIINGHIDLRVEGPPNPLRKDHANATAAMAADIDPERPLARLESGDEMAIVQQGEWSEWLTAEFPLLPHIVSARGMFRVFAKQLHPRFELYVSPVNIDPLKPALPIAAPASLSRDLARNLGRFYTLGIAEDTAALRQGVFDLPQFLAQSRLVLRDEQRLLDESLRRYTGGFLFFYFSAVDQNSHMLWGKHDEDLMEFYRAIDTSIGEVMGREPGADLLVMSDHGFTTFERAVNLNTWLLQQGLLSVDSARNIDWPRTKAYGMGLNALYLTSADREDLKRQLLSLRDPENGRAVVETLTEVHAAPANRGVAPDLIIGYAPGYRASWQTGLGEVPDQVFETNTDAWIADHCINAADVPGVLFTSRGIAAHDQSLKTLSGVILRLFGI
jgi:predicted AlkP superfamily phosphohydrolase/phosphomutase